MHRYSTVQANAQVKTFPHFSHSPQKKRMLKHTFAIVIQHSQLTLFCVVSETKGFRSQNATTETSNQHLYISTSKGRNGCCFNKTLTQLVMTPQEFCRIGF